MRSADQRIADVLLEVCMAKLKSGDKMLKRPVTGDNIVLILWDIASRVEAAIADDVAKEASAC